MAKRSPRQPYPREDDSPLAKKDLFPKMSSPLPLDIVKNAIENAFIRSRLTKTGNIRIYPDSPSDLVKICIQHLKERADPVLGVHFYSQLDSGDIFDMDAVPHEMQRLRMQIGVFYQYLLIELMRASMEYNRTNGHHSNFVQVFDGMREGDITADINPPSFPRGLRLYISVKKSYDTVGGQDIPGVIARLEGLAKTEKNLTSPYLCVIAVATPDKGKILSYDKGRIVKNNQDGHPHSENCEVWMPDFIYPYITGRHAVEIYAEALKYIEMHMPFYSLKFRQECTELLKKEFIILGITDKNGIVNKEKFFKFVAGEVQS